MRNVKKISVDKLNLINNSYALNSISFVFNCFVVYISA